MEHIENHKIGRIVHDVTDEQIIAFFQDTFWPPYVQAVRLKWCGELSGPLDVTLEIEGLGSIEGRWEGGEGEQVREIELPSWMAASDEETHGPWWLLWRSVSGEAVHVVTHRIDIMMRCPDPTQPTKRSAHPRQRHT